MLVVEIVGRFNSVNSPLYLQKIHQETLQEVIEADLIEFGAVRVVADVSRTSGESWMKVLVTPLSGEFGGELEQKLRNALPKIFKRYYLIDAALDHYRLLVNR